MNKKQKCSNQGSEKKNQTINNKLFRRRTEEIQNKDRVKKEKYNNKYNRIESIKEKNKEQGQHSPIFDEERGQYVCNMCGMVLEEKVPLLKNGTRAYSQEERERKDHHGNPINPLLPDIQMATMVKRGRAKSQTLRHALRWDTRYSWRQRNLIKAISEIRRLGTKLALPNYLQESAADLYKRLYKRNLLKGRSIKGMVTAVLYYLTAKENVFRPLEKISRHANVPQRKIHNCYQIILGEFNLRSPVVDPKYLLSRPVSNLNLPAKVEKIAIEIINFYRKIYTFSGLDPKGVAAAALYYAVKHQHYHTTQAQIAKQLNVTEVTMRKRFVDIEKMIQFIKENRHRTKKGEKKKNYCNPELPKRYREREN